MAQKPQWLQDLKGVEALAILTDADLLSHKNGHALYYDGLEPLQNECIIISADPDYFLENLKCVSTLSQHQGVMSQALQSRKRTLAHSCPTSPLYATSIQQLIAFPILEDQVAHVGTGICRIRPIYVRKRSDRDARRGDTLLFIKEYHLDLNALIYTASWLSHNAQSFAEIPTDGSMGRVERSDVIRYSNDYYIYESGRPQLQDEQGRFQQLDGQTIVIHNHLSYWTPVFKETWTFFPLHAPYHKTTQTMFREELWTAAQSGHLCDVLIRGKDFDIPAHCIVLRMVPYYKVMFASMLSEGLESRNRHYQPEMEETETTRSKNPTAGVQILSAPPFAEESVLRGFLYYVYMGRAPLEVFVSSAFALDLILIADFYGCSELVREVVYAVSIEDPELALDVVDSIEETSFSRILKDRAMNKLQNRNQNL